MADEIIRRLEQSPLPKLVEQLGVAISQAQFALDRNSVETFKLMAATNLQIGSSKDKKSMIELGLLPSFYHFAEARIEAKVAFSMMTSTEVGVKASVGGTFKMVSASVEASYTSKYSFQAEGSSMVMARIVTVPAPAEVAALIAELRKK